MFLMLFMGSMVFIRVFTIPFGYNLVFMCFWSRDELLNLDLSCDPLNFISRVTAPVLTSDMKKTVLVPGH